MLKNWKSALIFAGVCLLIFITVYQSYKDKKKSKQRACATVKMRLNGVLTSYGGRNELLFIVLNNSNASIGVASSGKLYQKGFTGNYGLELGDSVIKKAGSKEITFKRGDSSVVFVLDCGD